MTLTLTLALSHQGRGDFSSTLTLAIYHPGRGDVGHPRPSYLPTRERGFSLSLLPPSVEGEGMLGTLTLAISQQGRGDFRSRSCPLPLRERSRI